MNSQQKLSRASLHLVGARQAVQQAQARTRAVAVESLGCVCGHMWHQHTRIASGAEPCKSFGCGCSDFDRKKEEVR